MAPNGTATMLAALLLMMLAGQPDQDAGQLLPRPLKPKQPAPAPLIIPGPVAPVIIPGPPVEPVKDWRDYAPMTMGAICPAVAIILAAMIGLAAARWKRRE